MIKAISKLGMGKNFLRILEDSYEKPLFTIKLNFERLKYFSRKIKYKARMSTLTTSVHHHTKSPSQWNEWMNECKLEKKYKLSIYTQP